MTRRAGLASVALAALLAAAGPARAQAWLEWDQSAAAMGRGGATTAAGDDPAAAFYNPAGIAGLFGTQVRVDLATAAREGRFDGFGGGSSDRNATLDLRGGLYATHAVATDLTLGLSVNSPWGLGVEWDRPTEFPGRFRAFDTALRSIAVSPVLAWRATPDLAVGGGVVLTYAVMDLERFEQDPDLSAIGGVGPIALARSTYELDGLGAGWVVGVSWRVDDALALGASLRGGMGLDLVGPVDFVDVAPRELRDVVLPGRERTVGEILDARYVDQDVRVGFELPRVASGGVSWRPIERVRFTADLQWTGWDDARSLDLDFVDDTLDDRQPLGFDDAWSFRAGVEVRHRPGQAIRLGFAHEGSPASGNAIPLVPDAERNALAIGFGCRTWHDVTLDLAYRVAFLHDREGVALPGNETPDGVYASTEHRWMVGASRRF